MKSIYVGQSKDVFGRLYRHGQGWGRHRAWELILSAIDGGWDRSWGEIWVWSIEQDLIGTVERDLKSRLDPWSDAERYHKGENPIYSWKYREPDMRPSLYEAWMGTYETCSRYCIRGCYSFMARDLDEFETAYYAHIRPLCREAINAIGK